MGREFAAVLSALRRACDRRVLAWFCATALVVIAGGVAAGLAPLALKHLIDAASARLTPPAPLALPVAIYGLALALQRLGEQCQVFCYARGELGVVRRFSVAAFEHLLRLPLAAHLDARSGALAQALAEGVFGLRLILHHLVVTALPVLVQLSVAALVVGAELGPGPSGVLVATLLTYAAVFAVGISRLDAPMRGVTAANVEAGGAITDSLMNVEALKAFVAERRYARRYDQALARTQAQWRLFHRRRLEHGLAIAVVFSVSVTASLGLAVAGAQAGNISLGVIVMLNAYLLQIIRPLEMLGFALRDIGQGLAYLSTLSRLLADPLEADQPGDRQPPPTGPAGLTFDKVSFSFGLGRQILNEVSFHAPAGARLALVGPSGAGKSSIVRLILGFYTPDGGAIRLDGRAISELGLYELRSQIAVVSQDTVLLNDSLAANIALGAANADIAEIAAAASIARLDDLLAGLPEGLQTPVGDRGLKLSGGEKQRVAIARAALKAARLIILDEATAALDPVTERAVWRALDDLSGAATRLIVTHRLAAVREVDEILVLDKGKIVERGDHDTLLAAEGLYSQLWRDQEQEPQTSATSQS